MRVAMQSPHTGKINVRDVNVTEAQLERIKRRDGLIQNIVPHLGPDDREFLLTGYTPEDWEAMFPPEDEELAGE